MMFDITGWFFEKTPFDAGRSLGIKVTRKLLEKRSKFQKIEIFETETVGRMLVLDDVIQLTEHDEFVYHEMFAHVPMNAHPDPKTVLVIGGGDGGVLRELKRYSNLERLDICEIDGDVIEASKEFLPFTASGYDDPRVNVHVADGAEFLKASKGAYDLILVDSSDPIGPAEVLFQRPFFESIRGALKPNGAALTQCESIFIHLDIIRKLFDSIDSLYARLQYLNMLVPTYPTGMIGLMICTTGPDFSKPVRTLPDDIQRELRYYDADVHAAAFTLPRFASQRLKPRFG